MTIIKRLLSSWGGNYVFDLGCYIYIPDMATICDCRNP
jgi:hypothetical protein